MNDEGEIYTNRVRQPVRESHRTQPPLEEVSQAARYCSQARTQTHEQEMELERFPNRHNTNQGRSQPSNVHFHTHAPKYVDRIPPNTEKKQAMGSRHKPMHHLSSNNNNIRPSILDNIDPTTVGIVRNASMAGVVLGLILYFLKLRTISLALLLSSVIIFTIALLLERREDKKNMEGFYDDDYAQEEEETNDYEESEVFSFGNFSFGMPTQDSISRALS